MQRAGVFEWAAKHDRKFGIENFRLFNRARKTMLHQFVRNKTVSAVRKDTKRNPRFEVKIAGTKKQAVEEDERDTNNIKVYTDGSGIGGQIGAAAVLYKGSRKRICLRHHLGSGTHCGVYEGECMGALMAIKLISRQADIHHITGATICIDNWATIEAATLSRPTPGRYIHNFHFDLVKLLKKHLQIKITIRWTPAHQGIKGNEAADVEARKAAAGESSNNNGLTEQLQWGKLATKQCINSKNLRKEVLDYFKISQTPETGGSNSALKKPLRDGSPTAPQTCQHPRQNQKQKK